jgi:hypothetical protein
MGEKTKYKIHLNTEKCIAVSHYAQKQLTTSK